MSVTVNPPSPRTEPEQGAGTASAQYGEIVVGVDGSANSRIALRWAIEEASRRGARLRVITAWTPDLVEAAGMVPAATLLPDPGLLRGEAVEIQNKALAEVLGDQVHNPDLQVRHEVVRGQASDALVQASRTADLLVLATHARGPVRQMILGSVSHAVVRRAVCPVVVIPPGMADS